MDSKQIEQFADEWYQYRIPAFGSQAFTLFAVKTLDLAFLVFGEYPKIFVDRGSPTAYAIASKKEIYLPGIYFNDELYTLYTKRVNKREAVAVPAPVYYDDVDDDLVDDEYETLGWAWGRELKRKKGRPKKRAFSWASWGAAWSYYPSIYSDKYQIGKYAITAINGTTVHEALHLKYSVDDVDAYKRSVFKYATELGISDEMKAKFTDVADYTSLFRMFLSIFEDLFIENVLFQSSSPLWSWVQGKNDIMIDNAPAQDLYEELRKEYGAMAVAHAKEAESKMGLAFLVAMLHDLLVTYKNREYREFPIFKMGMTTLFTLRDEKVDFDMSVISDIVATMEIESMDFDVTGKRTGQSFGAVGKAVLSILSLLPPEELKDGEMMADQLQCRNDEIAKSQRSTTAAVPRMAPVPEEIEKMAAEVGERRDTLGDPTGVIAEAFEAASSGDKKVDVDPIKTSVDETIEAKAIAETIVTDKQLSREGRQRSLPEKNNKLKGFTEYIRQIRTLNHTPGEPLIRGPKIVNTRLSRIATDGKIFSIPQEIKRAHDIEVILLIDCSGSMGSSYGYDGTGSLYARVAGASRDIYKSLKQSNIKAALFGHTSVRGDQPVLIKIAANKMRLGQQLPSEDEAFRALEDINLQENYDGLAIKAAYKYFSALPNTRRIMAVLSDGQPCGPGYHGSFADRHVKEVVTELRKRNVDVVCFSLVPSVESANDVLYGKEYNIKASQDIGASMRAVFSQILKEK